MQKMLVEFQPDSLEDLILLNAAYRPGPLQYIPEIIQNKRNPSQTHYDIEAFRPILQETYGKPVYQEQIMQMFTVAGYSLGESDIIRRAMAKKKEKDLIKHKDRFLQACVGLGMAPERTESFWSEILEFSKYAFNKSHATAYAINSYITAWLKYYHPLEFMSVAMSVQKMEKLPLLIQECRIMSIPVLGPNVNQSKVGFTPEGESIRFGLKRIKGVGEIAEKIVEEREKNGLFKSLTDFMYRVQLNSKAMQALIDSGALDTFGYSRASLTELVNQQWSSIQAVARKLNEQSDQLSFFSRDELIPDIIPPSVTPWPAKETYHREFLVLQSYINGHPAETMRTKDHTLYISDLDESYDGKRVSILALIENRQTLRRKSDSAPMAKLMLSDESGWISAVLFTKQYATYKDLVEEQEVRIFKGLYQYDENDPQLFVEEVLSPTTSQNIYVRVPTRSWNWARQVWELVRTNSGPYPLFIVIADEPTIIKTVYGVSLSFIQNAKNVLGEHNVLAI